jgi:hypothetical protein
MHFGRAARCGTGTSIGARHPGTESLILFNDLVGVGKDGGGRAAVACGDSSETRSLRLSLPDLSGYASAVGLSAVTGARQRKSRFSARVVPQTAW